MSLSEPRRELCTEEHLFPCVTKESELLEFQNAWTFMSDSFYDIFELLLVFGFLVLHFSWADYSV